MNKRIIAPFTFIFLITWKIPSVLSLCEEEDQINIYYCRSYHHRYIVAKKKNEIGFTKVEIIELKKVKSNLIVFDSLLIVCFRLGI